MIRPAVHRFDSVTSTNDVALDMARRGEPEGTVVVARSQTAGRGRRGRMWLDEPGQSLTMSIILRPQLPVERVGELAFVASLAVGEYLRTSCSLEPMLKWPNDVFVRERKIAGILVETTLTEAGLAAVVGIGLNVNQKAFPPEIEALATSIAIETGIEPDIETIAEPLAQTLLATCEADAERGFEEILSQWRKYMWGVGKEACIESDGHDVRGTVTGVNQAGALLLQDSSGETHTVSAGGLVIF